jgi:uncharacterized lipoprotein YmbA
MTLRISPLLMALTLTGCKSTTVHLYTLAPAPTAFATVEAADAHRSFLIESLSVPTGVDRKQLIEREENGELQVLENHQWASTLREETRRALTADLENAAAAGGNSSAVPLTFVEVSITQWESTTQAVYLKVEWRLWRAGNSAPFDLRCASAFSESTSGAPADLIRADALLVDKLAQSVAHALGKLPPASCSG